MHISGEYSTLIELPFIPLTDPRRIGAWDGTPQGFLNFGDTPMKPTYMHPVSNPWRLDS